MCHRARILRGSARMIVGRTRKRAKAAATNLRHRSTCSFPSSFRVDVTNWMSVSKLVDHAAAAMIA